MKNHFLTFAAGLLLISNTVFAQNEKLVKKISDDACPCLGTAITNKSKEDFKVIFTNCIAASFIKYEKEVSAETQQNTEKTTALGAAIGSKLAQECPAFLTLFTNNGGAKMFSEAKTSDVSPFDSASFKKADPKALLTGKFVTEKIFVNGNEVPSNDKTAYAIVKNGIWTDYAETNKYKSEFSVVTQSDYNYQLTLKSNNNPNLAALMKVGDKYTMRLIGVDKKNPNKYYTVMELMGMKIYSIQIKSAL